MIWLYLAGSVQRAFETESVQRGVADTGCLAHNGADEVVGNEVHFQFFVDHRRGQATEHVHVQGGLNVIQIEFDIPAPCV